MTSRQELAHLGIFIALGSALSAVPGLPRSSPNRFLSLSCAEKRELFVQGEEKRSKPQLTPSWILGCRSNLSGSGTGDLAYGVAKQVAPARRRWAWRRCPMPMTRARSFPWLSSQVLSATDGPRIGCKQLGWNCVCALVHPAGGGDYRTHNSTMPICFCKCLATPQQFVFEFHTFDYSIQGFPNSSSSISTALETHNPDTMPNVISED